MLSNISVVLPQVLFAQSVRKFIRKMALRILPGISLEQFQLESDSVFEASVNAALSSLRDNATDRELRAAIVVVTFNDVNRLCGLLKQACIAVGLGKIADDYLRHSYFSKFVLSQDVEKMRLLMRIADNDDTDLTRVFFHIARVLNGKATSYETLDYAAKAKAESDVCHLIGEVKGTIALGFDHANQKLIECKDDVKADIAAVGEKVDAVARSVGRRGRKPHDGKKVEAVQKAWSLVLKSEAAKCSVNTKPTFELAMRFAKPILEEAGVTDAREFARIRHAIAMREYRQRVKALAAKGTR